MYIINRRKNIRLIGDEHHIGDDFEFDEDEYYDAVDCFRYCTNPYIN